jgi:asparagine synthase (glutamine-hydrolysing)
VSGIYGVVTTDGAPVARETLAPMAAALSFYGPDGHGQWCGGSAGLGHLMLHVTPESLQERQPASLRQAPHLIITADARIDNRDELFDALGVPLAGREKTPDSSLILLAFERWGEDCPKKLLGDFAFAIWNQRDRTLFCARDPFGCKPFVYYYGERRFIFASDINGVLANVESQRLNYPLLAAYLQMKTYYAEKRLTFFENIVKLEAAHIATLRAGELKISRYWSPEDVAEVHEPGSRDYDEHLAFLFRQAVECRVRSAFSVGSHLSGGLDSSSVTILASRLLRARGKELATFSWSPAPEIAANGSLEGEYGRIDAICREENICCEYVPATAASFTETFRRDITVEPLAMMAREANVQACARARQVCVILSGWGGDDAVTCRTATSPVEFLNNHQWAGLREAVRSRRLAGLLHELVVVSLPDSVYALTTGNAHQALKTPCIQSEFAHRYRQDVRALRAPAFRRLPCIRANICRFLDSGHLTMRMEHWAASGARNGLVYRYPMLDRRLVEFALGTKPSELPGKDQRRALFRQAVGDLLPSSCDWEPVKRERSTVMALQEEHIRAHAEWARHLASQNAVSPATTFVDPAKTQAAVALAVKSGRMNDLSGVREAFGCYAIGIRHHN